MAQDQPAGKTSTWNQWFREWLATIVVVVSLIAVALLGVIAIYAQHADAKEILTMILPMIGTWVGTVLAFYFGKEQLEAATRSVTAIASQLTPEEKLRSLPVTSKMIPKSQAHVYAIEDPSKLKLLDAVADLEAQKKGNRLPILTVQGSPLNVIHRSIIDRFIAKQASAGKTADELKALTLADLLKDSAFQDLTKNTFAVVSQSATLADAKRAMDAVTWCQDVFVSPTGQKDEGVIGWITNSIIEDNSKV